MNFYRKMIRLRNENEVLQMGVLTVDEGFSSAKIFAFSREMKGQKLLVLMNFSKRNQKVESVSGENLISTYMDFSKTELKPFEGRIIRLQ